MAVIDVPLPNGVTVHIDTESVEGKRVTFRGQSIEHVASDPALQHYFHDLLEQYSRPIKENLATESTERERLKGIASKAQDECKRLLQLIADKDSALDQSRDLLIKLIEKVDLSMTDALDSTIALARIAKERDKK